MEPHALRHDEAGVITLTLNRPAKLNAIGPEMREALRQAVHDLGECEEHQVLVIRGNGRYFSAGVDLGGRASAGLSGQYQRRGYRTLHLLLDEIECVEKPVILAAQGPCLGLGVELACSCDFRFASEQATFRLPEVELGVIPGSGGVSRLTQIVGPAWARWMAMAGQGVDAERALAIGLVHDVWPMAEFEDRLGAFVKSLVALPSEAVGLAKLAIGAASTVDPGTARNVERLANATLVTSNDFRSRAASFTRPNDTHEHEVTR
jgi:enoyl-CoA hydratase